jgi:hypothetical protein
MKTVHEILKAARQRIEKPEHWTQGFMARDKDGNPTKSTNREACQWCALGAISAEAGGARAGEDAQDELYRAVGGTPITDINDRDGHAAVLSMFDKAIAATQP